MSKKKERKANAHSVQIKISNTGDGDVCISSVHRGRQNQPEIKVPVATLT